MPSPTCSAKKGARPWPGLSDWVVQHLPQWEPGLSRCSPSGPWPSGEPVPANKWLGIITQSTDLSNARPTGPT